MSSKAKAISKLSTADSFLLITLEEGLLNMHGSDQTTRHDEATMFFAATCRAIETLGDDDAEQLFNRIKSDKADGKQKLNERSH